MDAEQTMTVLVEICRLAALISPESDEETEAMSKIFDGVGDMQDCVRGKD